MGTFEKMELTLMGITAAGQIRRIQITTQRKETLIPIREKVETEHEIIHWNRKNMVQEGLFKPALEVVATTTTILGGRCMYLNVKKDKSQV
jgi:hypothetical protein